MSEIFHWIIKTPTQKLKNGCYIGSADLDSQFSTNNHNLYDLLKQTGKHWKFFLLFVLISNILAQPFLSNILVKPILSNLQLGEKKTDTHKIDLRFNNFIPHYDFYRTLKLFKSEFGKKTNFDNWKKNNKASDFSFNYVSNYPSGYGFFKTDTLLGNLKDKGNVSVDQKLNQFRIETTVEKVTTISDALSYISFINAGMCEKQREFLQLVVKQTISDLSTKLENKNQKEVEAAIAILAMERSYHNTQLVNLEMNCDLVTASSHKSKPPPQKSGHSLLAFLLSLMVAFWTIFILVFIRPSKSRGKA